MSAAGTPIDRRQAGRASPGPPCAMSAAIPQAAGVREVLTEDLLRRFDIPGPRYTSYPTADRFVEAFGPADYAPGAAQRRAGRPRSRCRCRCTCTSRSASRSATTAPATRSSPSTTNAPAEYLRLRWRREVALHVDALGAGPAGVAAALGRRLADVPVRRRTARADGHAAARLPRWRRDAEMLDRGRPAHRDADAAGAPAATWASTASASACRTSIPTCRRRCTACSRSSRCATLMASARELGFDSINVDLIYGLPKQTPEIASRARWRRSASCGPTASRCMPTRTCRSASSRSGASPQPTCRTPRQARHAGARDRRRSSARGYVLHRHGPLRAAGRRAGGGQARRAGCIATSRATARSPTAT